MSTMHGFEPVKGEISCRSTEQQTEEHPGDILSKFARLTWFGMPNPVPVENAFGLGGRALFMIIALNSQKVSRVYQSYAAFRYCEVV